MAESSEPQLRGKGTDVQAVESDGLPSDTPSAHQGPKPIQRLLSEDRVSRIVPETDSGTVLTYCSDFVRDFVRSDWNYVTSKMSVATRGKVLALDMRFREANQWMDDTLAWSRSFRRRPLSLRYDKREVLVTHSLAGRLVRLLNQHDQLFANVLGAYLAANIDATQMEAAMGGASRHIRAIHRLCIPDNNRFSRDGKLVIAES
ncbi:hypothetical protein [Cupriavidus plantarum]|uniref:hypothetical protein n=1 Tax=Cupriavidus plantarum TaxID=942865 RepID=UPI00339D9DCE